MDVRGKPLGMEGLRLEKPADLGRGQCRDVAEPHGGQVALAFGLHHAPVANEDHLGDPKTGLECVYLLRHGHRVGRVALIHMDGQGLSIRRGQQPNHDLRLARLLITVIPKGCQFILLPLQVGGGHVIQDHRRSTAPLPYRPTIERILNMFLLLGQAIKCRVEVILIKVL